MVQHYILPAGATLWSESRRDSPSFAISIWFPFGSRNEAPETRGFIHFIEHMLFKGTPRHDAYSIWRQIERTGGYANGFTDRDCLCVYFCVPASDWRIAVDLIVEVVFSSVFSIGEFEKERDVIVSEILQVEDDIEESAFDAFLAKYWQGNPASLSIAGTCAEVKAIGRDRLFAFYRKNLVPGNAFIAATGGGPDGSLLGEAINQALFAATADLPAVAADHVFGQGQVGSPFDYSDRPLPSCTPPAQTFRGFSKAPASQIYYFDALQLMPPFANMDFFGLSLINSALGEASTSRLFQRIREKLGLAYTVQSSLSYAKTEAVLAIQAVTGNRQFEKCVSAIDEETVRLISQGLSEEELCDAKSRLSGGFLLSLEDPDSRIRRMWHWFINGGKLPGIEEETGMYNDVRMEDIESLLARLRAAPRGMYAYGGIKPGIAKARFFQEM